MRMPVEVQTGHQRFWRIGLAQKMNMASGFSKRRKTVELPQLCPGSNNDEMKIFANAGQ